MSYLVDEYIEGVLEKNAALRRENKDLRARLKAARELVPVMVGTADDYEAFQRATDLRCKNWRKP